MIISDLSYLEEVSANANVVGGDGFNTDINIDFDFDKDVKITETLTVDKLFKVDIPELDGNSAVANATAQAVGDNTTAQTLTAAFADTGYSDAFSESIAVSY